MNDINNPEYWNDVLSEEGLGDIDEIEGFGKEEKSKRVKRVNNILGINSTIEDIEEKYNVKLIIDFDNSGIEIFGKNDNRLIGYIRKGFYTYNNISGKDHLEKFVLEEYRGKGYGQVLFEMYENIFSIPKYEYSHKPSSIKSLLRNGYIISGIFDDNGQEQEITFQELVKLEYELNDLIKSGDKDLPFTYKLTIQR